MSQQLAWWHLLGFVVLLGAHDLDACDTTFQVRLELEALKGWRCLGSKQGHGASAQLLRSLTGARALPEGSKVLL